MNSTAGDSIDRHNEGWWADEELALTQNTSSQAHPIPTGFSQEYHVLAEICGNMSSGFMLLNMQKRVVYVNASALRLLRITPTDLSATDTFDVRRHLLSLAADPQHALSELERIWRTPEQEYSTDIALVDATVTWLRLHNFPVRDKRNQLLGCGFLLDDMTLEHAARAARGETLALAATELKTPLAIIKGCATTLLGSSSRWDVSMQREMLQMIDAQSDRLYDVLNTLLDVWRFDAGTQDLHLSQVYLPELLQQLIQRWQKQAAEHRFQLSIQPEVATIVCDAARIEQTMNHLLNNAVQHTPAGKLITMRAEANEYEVRLSLADEGVGIAPEHLDVIFDRFYRVKQGNEQQTGSGLGLSAARATVEAHGGKIWADSPGSGRGSTFYMTLPFAPKVAVTTHSTGPLVVPEPGEEKSSEQRSSRPLLRHDRRLHVLVAEKDPRLARYLRANLEEQQYRVQLVSHGVQFLRQLELEEPDLVLLSSRLADVGGIELLQRMREFSQTPVIMLCEPCDEEERVQIFDMGSDDLLLKPFGMRELLARVRALLRRQASSTDQGTQQTTFTSGDLTIDYAQHLVTLQGKPVQLSRTEYKLLTTLTRNAGIVVTHELLLEKVWGPEYNRDIDFIWVYISRLRRKIEQDSRRPKYILTVEGVGYKLAKIS